MINKKGGVIVIVVIVLLVVLTLGLLAWDLRLSKSLSQIKMENGETARQKELAKSVDERLIQNVPENKTENSESKDIIISSPQAGELVNSPLVITGQINGNGWSGFEGQAGTVELRDEKGQKIGLAVLEATSDWMKLPTKFKATLKFTSLKEQDGQLVFKNENPSGMPENNREFSLAVKLEKTK